MLAGTSFEADEQASTIALDGSGLSREGAGTTGWWLTLQCSGAKAGEAWVIICTCKNHVHFIGKEKTLYFKNILPIIRSVLYKVISEVEWFEIFSACIAMDVDPF